LGRSQEAGKVGAVKKDAGQDRKNPGYFTVVDGLRQRLKGIACLVVIAVLPGITTTSPASAHLFQYQSLRKPTETPRCISPILLDMAWEEAIDRAMQYVQEGVLPHDVLDRLLDARAKGVLPFAQPDRCAQPVFEPFTAALIASAVILGITLLVWAIAMAGSV